MLNNNHKIQQFWSNFPTLKKGVAMGLNTHEKLSTQIFFEVETLRSKNNFPDLINSLSCARFWPGTGLHVGNEEIKNAYFREIFDLRTV